MIQAFKSELMQLFCLYRLYPRTFCYSELVNFIVVKA